MKVGSGGSSTRSTNSTRSASSSKGTATSKPKPSAKPKADVCKVDSQALRRIPTGGNSRTSSGTVTRINSSSSTPRLNDGVYRPGSCDAFQAGEPRKYSI